MPDVLLRRFQPLHLKVEQVGPFRSTFELPLTGTNDAPANFFLLVSKNGFGKTTILDVIHSLVGGLALSLSDLDGYRLYLQNLHPDLKAEGKAQLDIRIVLESGSRSTSAVLSLYLGADQPLRTLTPSLLEQAQAEHWLPLRIDISLSVKKMGLDIGSSGILKPLLEAIRSGNVEGNRFVPNGDSLFLPTALYFTADRRILQPSSGNKAISQPNLAYAPAHKFTTDGESWGTSLDGLLVWYEWLGGGLFETTRDLVNTLLFTEGRKRLLEIDHQSLGAVIEVEYEDGTKFRHCVDRLSHGERSLMHLLVRSAYHRAGSTILMIDEMETHLHPRWQHKVMTMLKEWIRLWPDLTVIATTHQPEMIEAFAFERPEEALVKGGYIIEAREL